MSISNNTIEYVENTDKHAELIDGNLVIEDKTTVTHNLVTSDIVTSLKNYISNNNGECKVFSENVALYISNDEKNFFLPDVMVVCDESGIEENGVHAVPRFIAEITSESTKKFDYGEKLETYRKIGVEEYWIVDIQKKAVFQYTLKEDYVPTVFLHPDRINISVFPDIKIDLGQYMK